MKQVRADEEEIGSLMKKEKEIRTQRVQLKMKVEETHRELTHNQEEKKREKEKQEECMDELMKLNELCLSYLGLEGPLMDALKHHCQQSTNQKTLRKRIDCAIEKHKQIKRKIDENQSLLTALNGQVDESVLKQLYEQREEKNQLIEALQVIIRDLSECEVREKERNKV